MLIGVFTHNLLLLITLSLFQIFVCSSSSNLDCLGLMVGKGIEEGEWGNKHGKGGGGEGGDTRLMDIVESLILINNLQKNN